jgi:MoxR-like ATPase
MKELTKINNKLNSLFLNREKEIRGMLISLIARQHVFLLGPPGTGKSRLIELFTEMVGGKTFSWQLTKFSKPEDLFGPVSIKNLKQDRMVRVPDGKMQESDFAYIDEIWKANSAILNALLSITNERIFYDGSKKTIIPLQSLYCASNELPQDSGLEAIFDRILFRFSVEDLAPTELKKVIQNPLPSHVNQEIDLNTIKKYQRQAEKVDINGEPLQALMEIKVELEKEGIKNYSRRYIEAVKALKAYAAIGGKGEVTTDHFIILPDILWRTPEERSRISEIIIKVAAPENIILQDILDHAKELMRNLPKESDCNSSADYITKTSDIIDELTNLKKKIKGLHSKKAHNAYKEIARIINETTAKVVANRRD